MRTAEAITCYDELLGLHLEGTRTAAQQDPRLAHCGVLRPAFVESADYRRWLDVARCLARGIHAAADALARDANLRRRIGIPPYLDAIAALDPRGGPSIIARFDGLIDRNGQLQVIEYNSVPGIDEAADAALAFDELPITRAFGKRQPFHAPALRDLVVKALRDDHHARGKAGMPTLGVPVGQGEPGDLPRWLEAAKTAGARVVVAAYGSFRHRGGRLEGPTGEPIDSLLPRWNDLLAKVTEGSPVVDAIASGDVGMVFGASRGWLASYKSTFELLSSRGFASLFDPEVAQALSRHVPWTRTLRPGTSSYGEGTVDLLPFVLENRSRLVLKPSGGSMGAGVLLGATHSDGEWHALIKRVLHQRYVVQERVESARARYPMRSDGPLTFAEATTTFEPYVWNGVRAEGALARVSTTGVHSLAEGASIPPCWILGSGPSD